MSVDLVVFDHAGNGVVINRDFVVSRCWDIVLVAMDEAPKLIGDTLFITSGVRSRLEGGRRTEHHNGNAVDFRTGLNGNNLSDMTWKQRLGAIECRSQPQVAYNKALGWRERIAGRLGDEFDIVYGIAVRHVNHIHGEHDSIKAGRRYGGS